MKLAGRKRLLILAVALSLGACSSVTTTVRNGVQPPASWDFIQSVGGLAVGKPHIEDGVFWLPLNLDLSGSRTITVAPTETASGMKCLRAELRHVDWPTTPSGYYNLQLQVFAGKQDKAGDASCDEVPMFVGELSPPLANPDNVTFKIWYRDYLFSRHLVDEVAL